MTETDTGHQSMTTIIMTLHSSVKEWPLCRQTFLFCVSGDILTHEAGGERKYWIWIRLMELDWTTDQNNNLFAKIPFHMYNDKTLSVSETLRPWLYSIGVLMDMDSALSLFI